MIKICLNSYDLWTAASRMKIPWNVLLLLKVFLDLMSNVFSYVLMIETMGIVVPREILKMNVRYCARRVVCSGCCFPLCPLVPPAMPWLPSPHYSRFLRAQLSASPIPAKGSSFSDVTVQQTAYRLYQTFTYFTASVSYMHIYLPFTLLSATPLPQAPPSTEPDLTKADQAVFE